MRPFSTRFRRFRGLEDEHIGTRSERKYFVKE